jgi:hypothetical protein
MLMDYPLEDMVVATVTDRPHPGGFDEVWLADGTQIGMYRALDIFPVVHQTLDGIFDVGQPRPEAVGLAHPHSAAQ